MGLNVGPQQWWLDRYGPPQRSLRFNSSDSAYLSRTPASAGNRKTWTWAGWVKRSNIGSSFETIFGAGTGSTSTTHHFGFQSDNLYYSAADGGAIYLTTTQVFRDPAAWYHIVLASDTTQATSTDRVKLYVNGVQITQFTNTVYPSQDYALSINNNVAHQIGARYRTSIDQYSNGYLADVHFIDGQALTPTSFGEFDTNGIWQPIGYTGTYGTNGFHLPFSDNSTAAALGTDTSGNGNDWTVNNIQVGDTLWSQYLSTNTSFDNSPANAFNGIIGGAGFNQDWGVKSSGTSTITFSGVSISVSSSLIVYVYGDNGNEINASDFQLNGSSSSMTIQKLPGVTDTGIRKCTFNTSYPFTLTSLSYTNNDSGKSTILTAIEIDGNLLVNGEFGDSLVDVPTNGTETDTGSGGEVRGNYATLNPLDKDAGNTLSNGNLDVSTSSSGQGFQRATMFVASGKWYWEITVTSASGNSSIGIAGPATTTSTSNYVGATADSYGYVATNGNKYNNNASSSYGATYTTNDVIGVALDLDSGTLVFYKNGASQGTAYSGLSGSFAPALSDVSNSSSSTFTANFGQRPFAYTAPSGFKALCTANLPTPVVTKPNTVFDTVLWTGNNTGQTITMPGAFSPDLVWTKTRNVVNNHWLFDVVRGTNQGLSSSSTTNELTRSSSVTAFGSTGFTLGTSADVNSSAYTYVAWTWDAGDSTVTNTDGSIASSVRANPSAGFSIIGYTGTGSNATVGHGLGVTPGLLICKSRTQSGGSNWVVWHSLFTGSEFLRLNTTDSKQTASVVFNSTAPSSTVISLGTDAATNGNGNTHIIYAFAPVDGYSTSFSYTGNGNADGPFSYLGFLPKLILIKCSSTTGNWVLLDTERGGYNVDNDPLFPNLSNAEATTDLLDITSNGFKLRSTNADVNANAATYIGYAWAESPFQFSRAR